MRFFSRGLVILTLTQVMECILWWGGRPGIHRHPPTSRPPGGLVTAGCGGTLGVRPGVTYVITSPGYPGPYPSFTTCQWKFFSVGGNGLVGVSCPVFDLEAATPCSNGAFLALQDPPSQQYKWYCGSTGPQDVASRSASLTVYFWGGWLSASGKKGLYCTVTVLPFTPTVPPTPSPSTCRCGRRGTNTRIVGGSDASLHEFPWMALLLLPSGLCGGTLINDRFVLTAAHCIDSRVLPNNALPRVVLGEHKRSVQSETPFTLHVQAVRVWPNEKYQEGVSKDNDIGLVELATILDLDRVFPNIAPACPPTPTASDGGLAVTTIGWGFTAVPGNRSDVLQKVEMTTVSLAQCQSQYQDGIVTANMICAAAPGKDSCFDDSGGPLLTKVGQHWEVVGVVSFGPTECAENNTAGVYTKVANYLSWIRSKVGNAHTCHPTS